MFPCIALHGVAVSAAIAPESESPLLREATFDELANITLTSVNRKPERSFTTAAAAYVLTAEEIHRAGDTGIPEALRTVPGLQVAQIDAYSWAISARGFNTLAVPVATEVERGVYVEFSWRQ